MKTIHQEIHTMINDNTSESTQELTEEQMEQVKGGPAYMKLGDIKGEVVGLNSVQITKLSKKSG